jgi:hypothetical protein
MYIYGLLIPTFSSLAEISGLYCTDSVSYLDVSGVKIFSVDYGLDFVTVVLYVARGITEMSVALFFRVTCIGRGCEWNIRKCGGSSLD